MDQLVELHLNANRKITGVLKGYDPFMNVVLDEAFTTTDGDKEVLGTCVIRGNSIQFWENLDKHS